MHSTRLYSAFSESTDTSDDILDLDYDVRDLDTSRPILPGGKDYEMVIKSVEVKPNKAETGNNLHVVFATTTKQRSTSGDEIPAGFSTSKYYPLQPNPDKIGNDDYDFKGFLKDLTILYDAANKIIDPRTREKLNRATFNALVGKRLLVPLSVAKADAQFPERNEVNSRSLKPIPE